jgi:hypothetical protein
LKDTEVTEARQDKVRCHQEERWREYINKNTAQDNGRHTNRKTKLGKQAM